MLDGESMMVGSWFIMAAGDEYNMPCYFMFQSFSVLVFKIGEVSGSENMIAWHRDFQPQTSQTSHFCYSINSE